MTISGLRPFVALLVLTIAAPLAATEVSLEQTVDFLLRQVAESDYVFVRNGKDHDAEDAAKHMRRKYEHFSDEIATPEQFIERSATKSLMTGRRYKVRFPDGTEMDTADWLLGQLAEFRTAYDRSAGNGE